MDKVLDNAGRSYSSREAIRKKGRHRRIAIAGIEIAFPNESSRFVSKSRCARNRLLSTRGGIAFRFLFGNRFSTKLYSTFRESGSDLDHQNWLFDRQTR